jgi:aryl-phospho-beta-D-glucosidase BglC (GH1 family)
MKKGDTVSQVRGNQKAVRWNDKQEVYVLTNIHALPAEGNSRNKSGYNVKLLVTENYNAHMVYVEKNDISRMT